MRVYYIVKIFVFVVLSGLVIGCSDDGTTLQQLQDASEAQDGDDGTDSGGNTVTGGPVMNISRSYGGANEYFFSLTDRTYWRVDNADSNLKLCSVSLFGDSTACDSESGFSAVPSSGIFNSTLHTYELNYDLLTNSVPSKIIQIFLRNGSGVVSGGYSVTLGMVPAVEFGGAVSEGARVSGNFILRAYGLLEAGAQWCAANIAVESPMKCSDITNYKDIDIPGTNWTYESSSRIMSLHLVHSELPKTTYKIRFRNKASGEMSKEMVVVIE